LRINAAHNIQQQEIIEEAFFGPPAVWWRPNFSTMMAKKSHHLKKIKQHFLSLSPRSFIFSNSKNLLPVYPVV